MKDIDKPSTTATIHSSKKVRGARRELNGAIENQPPYTKFHSMHGNRKKR